jgi:hypothetical protein
MAFVVVYPVALTSNLQLGCMLPKELRRSLNEQAWPEVIM